MEVPYWSSTTCLSASFDEAEKRWTVELDRNGERVTLRPAQLVLATGMSGKPTVPTLTGQDEFRGDQHIRATTRGRIDMSASVPW